MLSSNHQLLVVRPNQQVENIASSDVIAVGSRTGPVEGIQTAAIRSNLLLQ
jgi:hypothetical protein